MMYPKIYLAIDNCFASKRWTDPHDWARVIRDLGLTYVEASADNEIDPFYSTRDFLDSWVDYALLQVAINQGAADEVKSIQLEASKKYPPSDHWLNLLNAAAESFVWKMDKQQVANADS